MTAWLLAFAERSAAVAPRPRTRFEQLSAVAAEVQPAVESVRQDTCHAEAAGRGITTAPGCCSGLPASGSHRMQPSRLAAVVVVGLAAARLGQPPGDHVADGQERDVPPGLVGPEVVGPLAVLAGLDQERGHQDAGEHDYVSDELGGLVGGLGLGAEPARIGASVAAGSCAGGPAKLCIHTGSFG